MQKPNLAKLPDAPIKLDGFPACRVCSAEVGREGTWCEAHPHGETPRDWDVLRRELLRQMRSAVAYMQNCLECSSLPLNGKRCLGCSWTRGAAMGVAGIQEYYGWMGDGELLLDMIAIREKKPGTQREQGARGAREVH